MPTNKPRVMVTIDEDMFELLRDVAKATDLSVAGIVNRFLVSHLHELSEYHEWLNKKKDSAMQMHGKNLLQSYGPRDLIDGISRIDPEHEFIMDRFEKDFKNYKRATKK